MATPVPLKLPDVSRIGSRLWVGAAIEDHDATAAAQCAGDLAVRASLGLVVDCRAGADDSGMWARHRVRYLNVGVDDAGIPLPDWFFTLGVEAVSAHWAQGRTREGVLIHCESGAHRSPALALAVLLVQGAALGAAVQRLTNARPSVGTRYFDDAVRWFTWFSGSRTPGNAVF